MEEKENVVRFTGLRTAAFERLKLHLRRINENKRNAELPEDKNHASPHLQESGRNQNGGIHRREKYTHAKTHETFVPVKQANFGEEPPSHRPPLGMLTRMQSGFTPYRKAVGNSLPGVDGSARKNADYDPVYQPVMRSVDLREKQLRFTPYGNAQRNGLPRVDGCAGRNAEHNSVHRPGSRRTNLGDTQTEEHGIRSGRKERDPVWSKRFQDTEGDDGKNGGGVMTRAREKARLLNEDQEGSRSVSGNHVWKKLNRPALKSTPGSASGSRRPFNIIPRRGMSAERVARLKEVLASRSPRLRGCRSVAASSRSPQPATSGLTPLWGRKGARGRLCVTSQKKVTPKVIGERGQAWSAESKTRSPASQKQLEDQAASQVCARVLQFEEEEVDTEKSEDDTEPLGNFSATPVLKTASVLKAPYNSRKPQGRENFQPVIKKVLLHQTTTETLKIQRRNNYNLRSCHQTRDPDPDSATERGGEYSNAPSGSHHTSHPRIKGKRRTLCKDDDDEEEEEEENSQMQDISQGASRNGGSRNHPSSQSTRKAEQARRYSGINKQTQRYSGIDGQTPEYGRDDKQTLRYNKNDNQTPEYNGKLNQTSRYNRKLNQTPRYRCEVERKNSNSTRKGKPTRVVTHRRSFPHNPSRTPLGKSKARRSGIPISSLKQFQANKSRQESTKAKSVSKIPNPSTKIPNPTTRKSIGRPGQRRSLVRNESRLRQSPQNESRPQQQNPQNKSHVQNPQNDPRVQQNPQSTSRSQNPAQGSSKGKSRKQNPQENSKVPSIVLTHASSGEEEEEREEMEMEREKMGKEENAKMGLGETKTGEGKAEMKLEETSEERKETGMEANKMSKEEMDEEGVSKDAATNTSLKIGQTWTAGGQIEEDVRKLVDEVEAIQTQAKLVAERTSTRRQMMQETGLLESLTTTLSPLRRLKTWLTGRKEEQEKDASQATTQENTTLNSSTMEESESLAGGSSDPFSATSDVSMQECSSLNTTSATPNLNHTGLNTTNAHNTSAIHWSQLKCDYQFLQTPKSTTTKRPHARTFTEDNSEVEGEGESEGDEGFRVKSFREDGSHSPFTRLVGDCERPSLAPMTPHSRQNVSLLKLSLKKQLDYLYEN